MELLSGITITRLYGSTDEEHYLVMSKDNVMEANRLTADLLDSLKNAEDMDAGIDNFLQTHSDANATHGDIKELVNAKILPMLLKETAPRKQFLYQRQMLSARQIDSISDRLSFLFSKHVMWVLSAMMIVADTAFFMTTENLLTFGNRINAFTIFALVAFVVCSSLFHELGHASACKRFGLEHGGVGFGMYINFPVLYTDVTKVWQLPRRKRIVVNIAGIYFQGMILLLLAGGFFLTGNDVLRYMILTMNFGFLLTLNPFFRFDGYWIATDMLGVPNLRKRSTELLRYFYKRMTRKPVTGRPYLLQIRKREKMFVIAYALAVNVFMGYYFLYIIPVFLYGFVGNFPEEVYQLILCMSNNITPPFALLRNMLSQILFLSLLIFMFYRMAYPMLMRKRLRKE